MKKLILTLAGVAMLLQACQKDSVQPKKQTVTYSVTCAHCSVYVTDNYSNAGNEQLAAKSKHFLVDGEFNYSFDNDTLSTASLQVYLGALAPVMPVKAMITTSDGKRVVLDREMGLGTKDDLITTTIYLPLK
ncbi:hypothetical protein [Mucilaginibacter endophyticus]|uniref:hypothetical protein n=1 Tax=Mucilaginibacter endophyticus TaxID=2675003 RepID=UPI000E0D7378|nr:hypothetical protein [Mucilaginibacter endophyticus]